MQDKSKFHIQIKLFDRDALEYAAKVEGLRQLLHELGYPDAEKVCLDIRNTLLDALVKQVSPKRTNIITKKVRQ